MTGLTSLPDETLKQIFDLALLDLKPRREYRYPHDVRESPHHFLYCMLLLCRRTHNIALETLYGRVRLDEPDEAERFLHGVSDNPALAGLLQRLELRLFECRADNEEKDEAQHNEEAQTLHRLSSLLRIATNLETLYLTAQEASAYTDRPHPEVRLEPHLIESLASLPALRVLKLRNWTVDVPDVPLLVGAIANKPHLTRFGFIQNYRLDTKWMKKTLLRDSWRKLERAGPDQLLMETDQQRFRPRAYMYRESADPDNGFLELMRSLREPWLLHLATGEHFSPPTMKILKTALEPCEVEVLHLRYCQKDPEGMDDQVLIDILNSQPSLKQLGVPYPGLGSPETVFAALPAQLEVLEVDRSHRDRARAPHFGSTLQGLQLMSTLITQSATPWCKLRTLRLPSLRDAAIPVRAFGAEWTSCGLEKACKDADIELGEGDALLDYWG